MPLRKHVCPALALLLMGFAVAMGIDWRNFRHGHEIPSEGYCDQPYVVVTRDGNWLCTMTTGPGREGDRTQHVVSTISTDRGKTWSPLVDIEPSAGPEASWVVPLVGAGGRVYAFYTYNGDKIYRMPGSAKTIRADTFGWFCYKYSDDNGRTWSARRYRLPMRVTACDRANQWNGRVQTFWGIDKPKIVGGSAIFAFTKLGRYMLHNGEGWLYRCDNVLVEADVEKLRFELLPEGDHGIRAAEFGSVQEEHNLVPLSDGKLYCVYRTTLGHPCHAYSHDGGRSWTKPEPMTYTPAGRIVRNPRACPKLWRTADGKFLFWYHNNGHRSYNGGQGHSSRNIAWLSGGIERGGRVRWSQPEIVCYCDEPKRGCSYPDLIEQAGRFFIASTQKVEARVVQIDRTLLDDLWRQHELKTVAREGLVLTLDAGQLEPRTTRMPRLPSLAAGGGFSLDAWIRLEDLSPAQMILDSRDLQGGGIVLSTAGTGQLRLEISDTRWRTGWDSDPALLEPNKWHHVVFIVDGGPKLISVVVDGRLCDGGNSDRRKYGYGRFAYVQPAAGPAHAPVVVGSLGEVVGSEVLKLGVPLRRLRIYQRYLRTSEAIGNYHAERAMFGAPGGKM